MNENWPEAYKKGVKDFYGRDFLVSPAVLIPRPETEAAIDEALLLAGKPYLPGMAAPKRRLPEKPLIVDVGTGSSCIAATLKLEIPEAKVIGLDISEEALAVARENAKRLGAEVKFLQSDLLKSYQEKMPDVVVANLPYVDKEWEWLDKKALGFEPSVALYAEKHGLALIFELIDELFKLSLEAESQKALWLLLEADPCQHTDIIKYATRHGFVHQKTSGFALVFERS
ncbi:HemK family protein methyltransferase [Candidatus Saccharibacteria bacterium]|nr:HemK family protein methyltransferase [Candidatus Saccharibacteria bacterium]